VDAKTARIRNRVLIAIGIAVAMLLLLDGVVLVTDEPRFCATCHEMRPHYNAWLQGSHKGLACVDCHLDPSLSGRIAHRCPSASQLVTHLLGKASLPLPTPPHMPAKRCADCHKRLPAKTKHGFQHTVHAKTLCVECHPDTGHVVTVEALKAAGVYPKDPKLQIPVARMTLRPGDGAANLQGHVRVRCSTCHDMGLTRCSACHKARHKRNANLGSDCAACHGPGSGFAFIHPAATSQCKTCHTVPSDHKSVKSNVCASCHIRPGVSWVSSHPGGAAARRPCESCHVLPTDHIKNMTRTCTACHKRSGVSWAASHPGASSICGTCHTPPAGKHPLGTCARCHNKVGVSFAFQHPKMRFSHSAKKVTCVKCHPDNYTSYSCICHK
jgi:nitrate/TMAO reductase-like tetraheme cytochrome c subunit